MTSHATRIGGTQAKSAVRNQRSIRRLRGSVAWEGNLEESRLGRSTKYPGVRLGHRPTDRPNTAPELVRRPAITLGFFRTPVGLD